MKDLVTGVHRFRNGVFRDRRELFTKLAEGQHPMALFITCSDSRIVPSLIVEADPGDLFILRNAGNVVPPYGASNGGEAATIEYAISVLNVQDVVVCGHSRCGVMRALLGMDSTEHLPLVKSWLAQSEATRRIVRENYADYHGDDLMSIAVQEHVLVQLENLQTHPSVAARVQRGKLTLHGWVYKLETGEVFSYSDESGLFTPLTAQPPAEHVTERPAAVKSA